MPAERFGDRPASLTSLKERNPMLNALEAFKRGLDVFLRWFCIILFIVLVLLVTWQVFVRQVLPLPNKE